MLLEWTLNRWFYGKAKNPVFFLSTVVNTTIRQPITNTTMISRSDSERTIKLDGDNGGESVKRVKLWPESRIGKVMDLDRLDALIERWCIVVGGESEYSESSLPIMFRRIMCPFELNTLAFYADNKKGEFKCLSLFATEMGFECHPVFEKYEVEIFPIGGETSVKYMLGKSHVPREWLNKMMIAIVPKMKHNGRRLLPTEPSDACHEYFGDPGFGFVFLFLVNYIQNLTFTIEAEMLNRIKEYKAFFKY